MSYHNDRGYNNYNNHHRGGFRHNQPRINENQVPQSKHTIFIRGLGGDVTTDEIKEYIDERVGKISFDFVKQAQDRSKIFVAVRFEKRDEAKEFMDTYYDREFMGYRCELSWFRDIRRYCAYQRSKQTRSNSQRRRRRSDSEEESRHSSRKSSPSRRSRSGTMDNRDGSRSPSPSPSRSRSRGRSRSNERRSRSTSRGSRSRNGHNESFDNRSDDEDVEPVRKNESRSKRRRDVSDSEESAIEVEKPKRKVREDLPQIPLPPKVQTPAKTKTLVYIPPPTVEMEVESPKGEPSPPQHSNPYQKNQHVTSYAVPMEEEAAPRAIVREEPASSWPASAYPVMNTGPVSNPYAQHVHESAAAPKPVAPSAPVQQTPAPGTPTAAAQPAFVPRQVGRIEILMPASLPAPTPAPVAAPVVLPSSGTVQSGSGSAHFTLDPAIFPKSHKLFGHLKAFQSALLSTVKYEPPAKKADEEELSSLRLSSFANEEEDTEEMKALEREEKLGKLNDEQMMRFHIKKKQFEQAFHNDCETYAVVTRALLAKDESLQFGLKMSLLENMDDLHKKMMKRVDDVLDALLQN